MPTNIKLKKSSVVGKIPVSGDLEYGELAINYADGYLYYKDATNNIERFLDSDQTVNAARNSLSSSGYISYNPSTGLISYNGPTITSDLNEPASPGNADIWFDNETLELKVWYEDSDSGQWVVPLGSPGAKGDPGTIVAVQDTAPSSPNVGDLWVDTST